MAKNRPREYRGTFGHFIRQRREAMGMTQRALGLAFRPSMSFRFISAVEIGTYPFPITRLATLTAALEVSEEQVVEEMCKDLSARVRWILRSAGGGGEGGGGGGTGGKFPK